MPAQGAALNTDTNAKLTSSEYGDRGDGTSSWFVRIRSAILERIVKAEDAAHASGDYGVMSLAVRRNTAAASSGSDGDYEPLQTDSTGRLRTLAKRDPSDALSVAHMAALGDDLVVKASAGTLHSIVGYVASGEDGWIQVHDATSQPSDSAVPELSFFVAAADADQAVNVPLPGHVCATGITIVWSTTGPTLTNGDDKMMVAAYYE